MTDRHEMTIGNHNDLIKSNQRQRNGTSQRCGELPSGQCAFLPGLPKGLGELWRLHLKSHRLFTLGH